MRRRWILGGALALLAAAAIAAVVGWRIGLDAQRGRIEQIVSRSTGRPFHLLGAIRLELAPLAIVTGPAELGNPPGMPGSLASWRSARIRLALLPLLHHRLIIEGVRLDGLEVHLRRDADGQSNWAGLAADTAGAVPANSAIGRPAMPVSAGAPLANYGVVTIDAIRLRSFEVRDGELDLDDRQNARRVRLSGWQLDMGPCRVARRIEIGRIRASASLWSSDLPGVGAGNPSAAAAIPVSLALAGATASLHPLALAIRHWSLDFAGAQLAGAVTAIQRQIAVTAARGAGAVAATDGKGPLSIDDIDRLDASGPISVRIASVRDSAAMLGIRSVSSPDPTALGALKLSGDWSLANGALTFKSLRLHLDGTTLSGRIMREPAAKHSWVELDLHGDHIDLDRYVATGGSHGRGFELPVAALRALRIAGSVTFDEVRFGGVELKNARLAIPAAGDPGREELRP